MKQKLKDININHLYQVREINSHTISRYKEAMKNSAKFPPLIIDENHNLIAGFHRYYSYISLYDMNYEIDVEKRKFQDEKEKIIIAVSDNTKHGVPLTKFELKKSIIRLNDYNSTIDEISQILNLSKDKVKRWSEETCVVIHSDTQKEEKKPLKHGTEVLKGKTVDKDVYDEIEKKYSGWNINFHINQLIKHLENDTWEKTEKTIELLGVLKNKLDLLG